MSSDVKADARALQALLSTPLGVQLASGRVLRLNLSLQGLDAATPSSATPLPAHKGKTAPSKAAQVDGATAATNPPAVAAKKAEQVPSARQERRSMLLASVQDVQATAFRDDEVASRVASSRAASAKPEASAANGRPPLLTMTPSRKRLPPGFP